MDATFRRNNGLCPGTSVKANGCISDFVAPSLTRKLCFGLKGDFQARAMLISGEDELLSHPNGVETQPDALSFGTLAADMAPFSSGFSSDNDEYDLDYPIEGFSSIAEAIEDIRQGKVGHLFLCF